MERRTLVSGGVTLLLLCGFGLLFDPWSMWRVLHTTRLSIFVLGLPLILLALVCWSEALRTLFEAGRQSVDRRSLFVAYCTGTFGRQVLPMGNAGGPALMAYAVSQDTGRRYDESLAVVTVDAFLSLLGTVLLAALGIGYLLLFAPGIPVAHTLGVALLATVGALAVVVGIVTFRRALVERVVQGVTRLFDDLVGERFPHVGDRFAPERISSALRRYYATIDSLSRDRSALVRAFGLSVVGRVCFSVPLYTGALALGVELSLALAVFVAIVSSVAAVVPLPGGLGSVELAVVGLLVALTGVEPTLAAATVVLFRLCSYWFLLVVSGLVTAFGTVGLDDLPTELDTKRR